MGKEETIDGVEVTAGAWFYIGPQGIFSGDGKMPEGLKTADQGNEGLWWEADDQ